MRVLLIEDDPGLVETLSAHFRDAGYATAIAGEIVGKAIRAAQARSAATKAKKLVLIIGSVAPSK